MLTFIAIYFLIPLLLILIALQIYRYFPIHLIYKSKIGLESMLDAVNEPLAVISKDHTIRRVNKAYADIIGRTCKTCIGAKCYTLLRGLSAPCDDCRLTAAFTEKNTQVIEISPHPNGTGTLTITFSPYDMPTHGKAAELCVIEHIRDITALERLKINLEHRNYFLDALTRRLRTAQRKIKAELRVAHQIQLGLFPPKISHIGKMRIDMTYKPVTDVGGDIYDFIRFDDNRVGIFIGDASGHGLASSLIGTLSKMSLYNHSHENLSASALLERMNLDLKAHIHSSHYLTCFWCIFKLEKNNIMYSRAGHPSQLVLRKNGSLHKLTGNGIFLGITEDAAFEEKEFKFEAGDRLFLFTDGIYDVFHRNYQEKRSMQDDLGGMNFFLGYNRFTEIVGRMGEVAFEDIIKTLRENLRDYRFEDDYTLIVAEICT
jgi:sigma-B regulation protein RsbU (phosphoserine phosphatase)